MQHIILIFLYLFILLFYSSELSYCIRAQGSRHELPSTTLPIVSSGTALQRANHVIAISWRPEKCGEIEVGGVHRYGYCAGRLWEN